jgi:DNA-binding IclR family transcriptional regulator
VLDLFLASERGLTLTEISSRLGVPKSTAHAVLKTVESYGYVSCDPATKVYSIGLRLIALASAASSHQTIASHARPHLERLAHELQESAALHAYEGNTAVAIDKAESRRSVRYSVTLGHRWPLHASSAGKLALARMSDDEVRSMASKTPFERLTDATIVDVQQLIAELARVRRNGYASQFEEALEEIAGYAAPVFDHRGELLAALTVIGPVARVRAQNIEIVPRLKREAEALSALLTAKRQ